jgi:DNA-binding response OmpR family regulator
VARILVVEDDPDVRPVLQLILRSAGHDVELVATAAEAHRLIETVAYDLVLTDGKLPDGDGIGVADRAEARGAKSLILSGYALQLPAAGLNRHACLMKPVRPAELLAAIVRRLAG